MSAQEPVAIVGLACRVPGANGPDEFWQLLRAGQETIGPTPPGRWDPERVAGPPGIRPCLERGGFLPSVDGFDADFFRINPSEASCMDPQHRLLLELAWEAIEDAGVVPDALANRRVGVFVGLTTHDYYWLMPEGAFRTGYEATGNTSGIAANRISYCLDLRGPSLSIDAACSSSLVAVHLACQSLRRGEVDLALVGAANVMLIPETSATLATLGILSPDARCRAFAAGANGIVRGEGAGMVVLKPLAGAKADGDQVYALLRGSAVNHSGRSNGLGAPSALVQEELLRAAYRDAGLATVVVDYVEAHGTGTLLGDALEARALGAVVGADRPADRPCRLGSVKTNLGHLEAAAGIVGLIKVALALRHREIPPSLHCEQPNPHVDFARLGLRVQTTLAPVSSAEPAAGVSAFGFGGANAHVVLSAASDPPAPGASTGDRSPELLPISAQTPAALFALVASYRDALRREPACDVGDFCHTARSRRTHHACRMAVVGDARPSLLAALDRWLAASGALQSAPLGRVVARRRRVAFVFPSRQPLSVLAARRLWAAEPAFRTAVERGATAFAGQGLRGVRDALLRGGGDPRLEPAALVCTQIGQAALWRAWGVTPAATVGDEVCAATAAYVAGRCTLDEAAAAVVRDADVLDLPARAPALPCLLLPAASTLQPERLGDTRCDVFLALSPPAEPRDGDLARAATLIPTGGAGADRTSLLHALAALYVAGVTPDFRTACRAPGRCVTLPSYPWQRRPFGWLTGRPFEQPPAAGE